MAVLVLQPSGLKYGNRGGTGAAKLHIHAAPPFVDPAKHSARQLQTYHKHSSPDGMTALVRWWPDDSRGNQHGNTGMKVMVKLDQLDMSDRRSMMQQDQPTTHVT